MRVHIRHSHSQPERGTPSRTRCWRMWSQRHIVCNWKANSQYLRKISSATKDVIRQHLLRPEVGTVRQKWSHFLHSIFRSQCFVHCIPRTTLNHMQHSYSSAASFWIDHPMLVGQKLVWQVFVLLNLLLVWLELRSGLKTFGANDPGGLCVIQRGPLTSLPGHSLSSSLREMKDKECQPRGTLPQIEFLTVSANDASLSVAGHRTLSQSSLFIEAAVLSYSITKLVSSFGRFLHPKFMESVGVSAKCVARTKRICRTEDSERLTVTTLLFFLLQSDTISWITLFTL